MLARAVVAGHRVDVASAVMPVLGPVRLVDLIIGIVVGFAHERNVLADATGLDVTFMAHLGRVRSRFLSLEGELQPEKSDGR